MGEIIAALIAACVALIGTVSSFLISQIKAKQSARELKEIKDLISTSNDVYYILCPHCGHKIYLNNVNINKEKKE